MFSKKLRIVSLQLVENELQLLTAISFLKLIELLHDTA